MDNHLAMAIKVEEEDLERDDNANIHELLFDVDIKVEKEVDESDWCVRNFNSPDDLLEPLFFKQLTEHLAQKCAFCHRCFPDEYSILKHNLQHLHVILRNPTLFQCDGCLSFFTDKHVMNRHIALPECRMHNGTKLPHTENPSKTLTLKYKPKAYTLINTSNKDPTQKYGKYEASNTTGAKLSRLPNGITNMLNYRPKAYKPIVPKTKKLHECVKCKKMYTYSHWHAHMSEVHGDGGYSCDICKMEFKCERYFIKHMRKRHQEQFAPQKEMPQRKRECKGNKPIPIKCDECDTVLQCRYALKTHKRNVHSSEKYVCRICKSMLKCKSYLLAHMKRVHYDDGKKHACECGKTFRSPRYLRVHKKNAHSNNKK